MFAACPLHPPKADAPGSLSDVAEGPILLQNYFRDSQRAILIQGSAKARNIDSRHRLLGFDAFLENHEGAHVSPLVRRF
jgi:hypothetical protein